MLSLGEDTDGSLREKLQDEVVSSSAWRLGVWRGRLRSKWLEMSPKCLPSSAFKFKRVLIEN